MKKDTQTKIPDFLFHIAQGFYDVGLNIAYNLKKDNSIKGFQRIAPAAVNLAFAIELFLKGLHLITTRMEIKDHNIWNLYKHLTPEIKDKIEKLYDRYQVLKSSELTSFRIVMTKEGRNGKEKSDEGKKENMDLKCLLKRHENAFDNWRYLHEAPPSGYQYEFDFQLMDIFIRSLIEVINEVKVGYKPQFVMGKVK